jgi:hypothetical protein
VIAMATDPHTLSVRLHIAMIINGLYPEGVIISSDQYVSAEDELFRLSPELLKQIAKNMTRFSSQNELVKTIRAWMDEHSAEAK